MFERNRWKINDNFEEEFFLKDCKKMGRLQTMNEQNEILPYFFYCSFLGNILEEITCFSFKLCQIKKNPRQYDDNKNLEKHVDCY